MIVVSGVMTFNPSIHDRVVERARTLTAETLKEPGCRTYGFWTDPDVPGRFRVFEEWDSQKALTGHFAAPHFAGSVKTSTRAISSAWTCTATSIQRSQASTKGPPLLPCPTRTPRR
jgi:quinol monooxygenase YgiN